MWLCNRIKTHDTLHDGIKFCSSFWFLMTLFMKCRNFFTYKKTICLNCVWYNSKSKQTDDLPVITEKNVVVNLSVLMNFLIGCC